MSDVLDGWGLKSRRRQTDGRAEIVGTNLKGEEYIARTCEGPDVTEHDLKILDMGNPEKRDINKFIGFYRDEREQARKNWEHSLDDEYMAGAERVVHAGLHLHEATVSFCHIPKAKWDAMWEKE
jgi:hypothetical protein